MESLWHEHILRVHYQDTDQMGVAHHSNYVSWLEISRTEMMRKTGITYRDTEKRGFLLPVVEMNVKYKQPAHYDDCLAIFTRVVRMSPIRLEFNYEVRRIKENIEETKQKDEVISPYGELLATASSSHIWVDSEWKVTRLNKTAPDIYDALRMNK